MTIKDYRYIYNRSQAMFYISHNIEPVEVKKHEITNNIYFKFKDSKYLQEVFNLWMAKKQTNKKE